MIMIILIALITIIISAVIEWGVAYLLVWLASLCFGFTLKIVYVWFLWVVMIVVSGLCKSIVTVNR